MPQDEACDELLLTDPAELRSLMIVREAYDGLVRRFQRQPEEARLIVADRLHLTPAEVDRALDL